MSKKKHIQRFPRNPEDYPEMVGKDRRLPSGYRLSQLEMTKIRARGKTPNGYNKLTKKQRRVARMVISGVPVHEVCRKFHMDANTFYRWLHCHKLFQQYYKRTVERTANMVETRLDAKHLRAVRIIEEALDSRDPYFAKETALDLLKGRGKLKHNIQTQGEITGSVRVDGRVETISDGNGMKELAMAFIEGMSKMALGGRALEPKIIDVKSLPPADIEVLESASSKVQEGKHTEAVGAD